MKRTFWDKTSGIYNHFMKKDAGAYNEMYQMIRPVVRGKIILELATGTGLIAKNIVNSAKMIEATDSSHEMIEEAKKNNQSKKLHFSVQDMFHLPYADETFSVIIVSNALHIIPEPEKALAEIRRVLQNDGILIAPTFTHANMGFAAKLKAGLMKKIGFPLQHTWSPESYLEFLRKNNWEIQKSKMLKASFPLTYTECVKTREAEHHE